VKRWTISPWRVAVLGCLLASVLLIVAIPDQWDLPDTAFQRGTAPLVVHSRTANASNFLSVNAPLQVAISHASHYASSEIVRSAAFLPSLPVLVSLRC